MGDDKLAAELATIRDETSVCLATPNAQASGKLIAANESVYRALAVLLASHGNEAVYLGATDCGCPEPEEGYARREWEADHPFGAHDSGRICTKADVGRYCPACTEIVYDQDAPTDSESYVSAPCSIRADISRALLGEGGEPHA